MADVGDVIVELHIGDGEAVWTGSANMILDAMESKKVTALARLAFLSAKLRQQQRSDPSLPSDVRSVGSLRLVRLSYCDEDGDDIIFTSDIELMEALGWAATMNRGRLCISAEIPYALSNAEPLDVEGPPPLAASSPVHVLLNKPKEETPEEDLGIFSFIFKGNNNCKRPNNKKAQPHKNFISFLLNGLGKKQQSDYGLCRNRSDDLPTEGGKISGSPKFVENNVHNNLLQIIGNKKSVILQASGTRFDKKFVHKRHACDGCDQEPIIGYRYHAINAYNIDLCEACFSYVSNLPLSERSSHNGTGDSLVFQLAQRKTDQSFKRVPRIMRLFGIDRLAQDIIGLVLKIASRKRIHESPVPLATQSEYLPSDKIIEPLLTVSDFDLQVAIQQSLHDLRRSTSSSKLFAGEKSDDGITEAVACMETMQNDQNESECRAFRGRLNSEYHSLESANDLLVCMDDVALTGTDDEGSDTSEQFEDISASGFCSSDVVGFDDGDWCAL